MRFLGVECIRKNIPMRNVTDTQYPYVINNPSYDTDTRKRTVWNYIHISIL